MKHFEQSAADTEPIDVFESQLGQLIEETQLELDAFERELEQARRALDDEHALHETFVREGITTENDKARIEAEEKRIRQFERAIQEMRAVYRREIEAYRARAPVKDRKETPPPLN